MTKSLWDILKLFTSFNFVHRLYHLRRIGTVAVAFADLGELNLALGINDERGRIGGLALRIPAQAVALGECVIRVGDEQELVRPVLVLQKFLRVCLEVIGRAGINH